jgi:hypothetical protein
MLNWPGETYAVQKRHDVSHATPFVEPESSLPFSQKSASGPNPESNESSPSFPS